MKVPQLQPDDNQTANQAPRMERSQTPLATSYPSRAPSISQAQIEASPRMVLQRAAIIKPVVQRVMTVATASYKKRWGMDVTALIKRLEKRPAIIACKNGWREWLRTMAADTANTFPYTDENDLEAKIVAKYPPSGDGTKRPGFPQDNYMLGRTNRALQTGNKADKKIVLSVANLDLLHRVSFSDISNNLNKYVLIVTNPATSSVDKQTANNKLKAFCELFIKDSKELIQRSKLNKNAQKMLSPNYEKTINNKIIRLELARDNMLTVTASVTSITSAVSSALQRLITQVNGMPGNVRDLGNDSVNRKVNRSMHPDATLVTTPRSKTTKARWTPGTAAFLDSDDIEIDSVAATDDGSGAVSRRSQAIPFNNLTDSSKKSVAKRKLRKTTVKSAELGKLTNPS